MINYNIRKLINEFLFYNIDGYIIPKNDEFFSENVRKDRLKLFTNFSGSAGMAVILKKKNYLFVDGRYTLQAKKQAGKEFTVYEFPNSLPKNIFKNLVLGFDPNLFTKLQLNYFFGKKINFKTN